MLVDTLYLVLARHGCRKITLSGKNLISTCPFHSDSVPSFEIRIDNGLYICFACGEKGSLRSFLSRLGENPRFLSQVIECDAEDELKIDLPAYEDRRRTRIPVGDAKEVYGAVPKYLLGRGFRERVLREWGVIFEKKSGRVVFPIRDGQGSLVGFTRRAVSEMQKPKYLHTQFPRSFYLYGMHRCNNTEGRLMVCEGHLDAIALYQAFGGNCVATMGCYVSDEQLVLMRGYKSVVLARDMDDSGYKWLERVGNGLLPFYDANDLTVFDSYGGCKDPAEVIESNGKFGKETTFFEWIIQDKTRSVQNAKRFF